MADDERTPSILTEIESAETPFEAVQAIGRLSLRRIVKMPIDVGRDLLKIIVNADKGEILSSSASHLN